MKLSLEKIISGGQTGADMGGLLAAEYLGIKTGGHCPRNYKTENGFTPKLKNYGLICTKSANYRIRTIKNVLNSDMTAIFGNINSSGSKLTYNLCIEHNKFFIRISNFTLSDKNMLVNSLLVNNIKILNIAGNRESKNLGIENKVKEWLIDAFKYKI